MNNTGKNQNINPNLISTPQRYYINNNQNNVLQNDMQRVFVQNNLTNSENNYSNSNEIIKNSINSRYMTKPNEINPISVLNYNFSGNGKYNEQLSNSQINNVNNSQILQISNNNNNFQQISIEVTIDKIRKKLTQRGVSGIFSIGKSFRINDTDNSKSISFSEFSNLCNKYSFKLNDVEIKSALLLDI